MSGFTSFIFRRDAEGDAALVVAENTPAPEPEVPEQQPQQPEAPGQEGAASAETPMEVEAPKEVEAPVNVQELFGLEGKQDKIALQKSAEGKVIVGAKLSAKDLEEEENDETRKPLDLVVVLDTSGSMSGQKLEMCKETCKFLLSELKADDRFAVVEFNTTVRTVTQLGHADDAFKRAAETAIGRLSATGSTNLSGGLFKGISMVMTPQEQQRGPDVSEPEGLGPKAARKARVRKTSASWNPISMVTSAAASFTRPQTYEAEAGRVRSVLLLTDGQANHGVSNPQRLSQMTTDLLSGTSISLFTFGYGSGHNADLLRALAECGRGSYYYVQTTDHVRDAFADCLGGLLTVVAQNVSLRIQPLGPYTVARVLSRRKHVEGDAEIAGGVTFEMGDLYAGENLYVLVELSCPAALEANDSEPLAAISVDLVNIRAEAAGMEQLSAAVQLARPVELSAEQVDYIDEDIAAQVVREETVMAIEEATRLADRGHYGVAQERLREVQTKSAATRSKISAKGAPEQLAMLDGITEDLAANATAFGSASSYADGRFRAANMMMNHAQQRGWDPDRELEAYAGKGRGRMKAKSKAYFS